MAKKMSKNHRIGNIEYFPIALHLLLASILLGAVFPVARSEDECYWDWDCEDGTNNVCCGNDTVTRYCCPCLDMYSEGYCGLIEDVTDAVKLGIGLIIGIVVAVIVVIVIVGVLCCVFVCKVVLIGKRPTRNVAVIGAAPPPPLGYAPQVQLGYPPQAQPGQPGNAPPGQHGYAPQPQPGYAQPPGHATDDKPGGPAPAQYAPPGQDGMPHDPHRPADGNGDMPQSSS